MIVIEIRNNELRAVQTSGKKRSTEIIRTNSIEIEPYLIEDLIAGNTDELKAKFDKLLEELAFNYKSLKYTLVVNLEGIMTQRVTIPKVKDKQIPLSLNSALISSSVPVSKESIVAFAVLRDKNKETYNILSQVLQRSISDNLTIIFNQLGIKIQYIDVSPNTIIKAFNRSSLVESEAPLKLVVDLSKSEARYYQFKDNVFELNYLENSSFKKVDSYLELFKLNIYQFLDEFGKYGEKDIELILMGDEEVIDKITEEFGDRFTIKLFSESIDFVDNFAFAKLGTYINSIGGTLRNDSLLSSHYKYDVNLLDKKNVKVKSGVTGVKEVAIGGTVSLVIASLFLGGIYISNSRIEKGNETVRLYVEDPKVAQEMEYSEALKAKLKAFDNALDTMKFADTYFETVERPYTSRVHYLLFSKLTPKSAITSVTFSDGLLSVDLTTDSEVSFMNYTNRLKGEDVFKVVTYDGYSGGIKEGEGSENYGHSASLGYDGTINIELVGGE